MVEGITGSCTVGDSVELIPDAVDDIIPPGYLDEGTLPIDTTDQDIGVDPANGVAITGDCAPSDSDVEMCPCPPELDPANLPRGINIDVIDDNYAPTHMRTWYKHGFIINYGDTDDGYHVFDMELNLLTTIKNSEIAGDGSLSSMSNSLCFNDDGSILYVSYFSWSNEDITMLAHIETATWTVVGRYKLATAERARISFDSGAEFIGGNIIYGYTGMYLLSSSKTSGFVVYSPTGTYVGGKTWDGYNTDERFEFIYMENHLFCVSYESGYGNNVVKVHTEDLNTIVASYSLTMTGSITPFYTLIYDLGSIYEPNRIGIFIPRFGFDLVDVDLNIITSYTEPNPDVGWLGAGMARYDETILIANPQESLSYQGVSNPGIIYSYDLNGNQITRLDVWASNTSMGGSYAGGGIGLTTEGYVTCGSANLNTDQRKTFRYRFLQ